MIGYYPTVKLEGKYKLLCLVENADSIFRVNVASARPDRRSAHQPTMDEKSTDKQSVKSTPDSFYQRGTYCIPVMISAEGTPMLIAVREDPISRSCRAVLTLLMVVGRTSADGIEKSQ